MTDLPTRTDPMPVPFGSRGLRTDDSSIAAALDAEVAESLAPPTPPPSGAGKPCATGADWCRCRPIWIHGCLSHRARPGQTLQRHPRRPLRRDRTAQPSGGSGRPGRSGSRATRTPRVAAHPWHRAPPPGTPTASTSTRATRSSSSKSWATGDVLGIALGNALGQMRTGALGGVAADRLARPVATGSAFTGSGSQA